MLNEFDSCAAETVKEGWVISGESGVSALYDIFHHLTDGGTISDYPNLSRDECIAMFGASWNSTRELSALIEEGNKMFGEDLEDDE